MLLGGGPGSWSPLGSCDPGSDEESSLSLEAPVPSD